ncbi:MAG: type II secretion system protein M [Gammaproteobacteria bacterium]|nr:MAG: type II secretion system protein M [Gammaproteobacteria bacterium]
MKEWFEQLAPRERLLVSIAGGLLIFALIVMLGVRPIMSRGERSHQLVVDKRALLTELQQVAARLGPQSGDAQPAPGGASQSLVLVVDRTTRSSGLAQYLKRNQPDGNTRIRLRFENAPFDTLITWLGDLQSQHGMSVSTANIDVSQQAGRVNCNLTLTRAGA